MRQLADIERQIDASFKRRLRDVVGSRFPSQLDDPDELIHRNLFEVLDELNHERIAPGIALRFGVARSILDLGLLGFTALSCADIGKALDVIYRYHTLTSDAYGVQLRTEPDRVVVTAGVRPQARSYKTVIAEEFATGFWVVLSELLPNTADQQRVRLRFDYPEPTYSSLYSECMGGRIEFGGQQISLDFPAEWSLLPLETADATVEAVCRAECDELLGAAGGGLVEDVKRLILSVPTNRPPRLHEIAAQLLTSPRTLERRLFDQGQRFRQIENETRMEVAAQYVSLGTMSGKQIAAMLGYSNPSSYYRAFKAWFGQTPADYASAQPIL